MDARSTRYALILSLSLFQLTIFGCTSIVKKPDVDRVKTVAILSLYADQKVPHERGMGIVTHWDDKLRLQVAEDALRTWQGELGKLGWRVVSPEKVLRSREYQEAFAVPESESGSAMGKLGSLFKNVYRRRFFTPAGMLPVPLDDASVNTHYYGDAAKNDPKVRLGRMAAKLGVDAVALVELDYCYGGGTFSLLGSGQAVITAGSSVKAVDRNGQVVVNMPAVARCDGKRGKSETSAVMINGNLQFTHSAKDRFRKMFIEATRESAVITVAEIRKAMMKQ